MIDVTGMGLSVENVGKVSFRHPWRVEFRMGVRARAGRQEADSRHRL